MSISVCRSSDGAGTPDLSSGASGKWAVIRSAAESVAFFRSRLLPGTHIPPETPRLSKSAGRTSADAEVHKVPESPHLLPEQYRPHVCKNGVSKAEHYAIVRELGEQFKKDNGSLICRELLGATAKLSSEDPSVRSAEYKAKRPCAELCRYCADILEQKLIEKGVI